MAKTFSVSYKVKLMWLLNYVKCGLSSQFSSVTQLCPTFCDPMDCSMPRFPLHHQLPELAQTHVHWVSDVIQLSDPLSSPSPPALNLSQHRGFSLTIWRFTSGSQSTGASASASVLPVNIQDWFPLGLTGWISLLSKGVSRTFSDTTVQKHQFFHAQAFFIVQLSHAYMTTGKTIVFDYMDLCWQTNVSAF